MKTVTYDRNLHVARKLAALVQQQFQMGKADYAQLQLTFYNTLASAYPSPVAERPPAQQQQPHLTVGHAPGCPVMTAASGCNCGFGNAPAAPMTTTDDMAVGRAQAQITASGSRSPPPAVSKPLGIGLAVNGGALVFTGSMPSRVEDKIWEAVQEARCAGWTVAKFRSECAEAWDHDMRDDQKTAAKEWSKP